MPSPSVLLTGAAGFIGSAVARALRKTHPKIRLISVDRLDRFENRPEHRDIDFGEKIDRDSLAEWLKKDHSIDSVWHIGAISTTTEKSWDLFKKHNIGYSQMLWRTCFERKIPFYYASSAATYGNGELGFDDRNREILKDLKPLNLYGQSKHDFDLWALAEADAGRAPPRWAGYKYFNVYGFGERHKQEAGQQSFVLQAFDQIRRDGRVRLFKSHRPDIVDGGQLRDFIHVDDVFSVMNFVANEVKVESGIYNLGTGQARSFLDLVLATGKSLGVEPRIEFIDTPPHILAHYQYFTEAKMEKIRAQGYTKPFLSLEAGVDRYVKDLLART